MLPRAYTVPYGMLDVLLCALFAVPPVVLHVSVLDHGWLVAHTLFSAGASVLGDGLQFHSVIYMDRVSSRTCMLHWWWTFSGIMHHVSPAMLCAVIAATFLALLCQKMAMIFFFKRLDAHAGVRMQRWWHAFALVAMSLAVLCLQCPSEYLRHCTSSGMSPLLTTVARAASLVKFFAELEAMSNSQVCI